MSSPLARGAILALAVAGGIAANAALDLAVVPAPWFVVTFVAVLLASWSGGILVGALAGTAIVTADIAGLASPRTELAEIAGASPGMDVLSAILAALIGGVIRATRSREQRTLATAALVTQASADADRRWQAVVRAIPELAALGTPLQVEDALVRHAAALAGRSVRFERAGGPHPPPGDDDAARRVPVVTEAGPVGALVVGSAEDEGLHDDERLGLAALATLGAGAFDRIRLRSASGTSVRSAVRSGERLGRLHSVTTRLAAQVTPEAIGEVVVGHVLDALGAGVGLFYLLDAAGDLRLAHARGYPIGLAGHDARLSPESRLPATDAIRDGRPVIVTSAEEWRRRYPGASDRLGITGTRSAVAWPIGVPATAVLVVQRTGEGRPTDDELAELELAGHQAMQAIERARIYAQEREARQLQEAFVGVMSHELRTPITTILAGSKLLTRDVTMSERSRGLALDVEAEADRLFRLVEDLLVLSRLERGSLSVGDEPVHLMRLLQRVVASEQSRWPETRFELPTGQSGHLVRGDETYVEQVVRNLLTNAAKYSPPQSTVRVLIAGSDDEVSVRVLDQGPGVSEAEVERLFGLFYRSPTTSASAAGAGIGLFVCRRLVGAMGGRIWARPLAEGGSEFGFALARYPDEEPASRRAPSGRRRARASAPPVAAGIGETGENGRSTGGEAR